MARKKGASVKLQGVLSWWMLSVAKYFRLGADSLLHPVPSQSRIESRAAPRSIDYPATMREKFVSAQMLGTWRIFGGLPKWSWVRREAKKLEGSIFATQARSALIQFWVRFFFSSLILTSWWVLLRCPHRDCQKNDKKWCKEQEKLVASKLTRCKSLISSSTRQKVNFRQSFIILKKALLAEDDKFCVRGGVRSG